MTKAQKITEITRIVKAYRRMTKAFDKLHGAVGFSDNPLYSSAWEVFDMMLAAKGELVGDKYNHWLPWFIMENDCGKNKLGAGINGGSMKPIRTIKQLVNLLDP